jgi:predicted oxidoreductase
MSAACPPMRAPSLDALADRLNVPAAMLGETVCKYNASAGNRPQFGGGPYIALGPVRSVFVHSEGGLAVDREHPVRAEDHRPIPGLYAAGSRGQGGLLLKGHGHHLGWAFTSRRCAERNAARDCPN